MIEDIGYEANRQSKIFYHLQKSHRQKIQSSDNKMQVIDKKFRSSTKNEIEVNVKKIKSNPQQLQILDRKLKVFSKRKASHR